MLISTIVDLQCFFFIRNRLRLELISTIVDLTGSMTMRRERLRLVLISTIVDRMHCLRCVVPSLRLVLISTIVDTIYRPATSRRVLE